MNVHNSGLWILRLLLLICSNLPSQLGAIELRLADQTTLQQSLALTPYFEVFEDASATLNLEQILSPAIASRFISSSSSAEALSFGYTRSAFWLRLQLRNDSAHTIQRILELSEPGLTKVEFHQIATDTDSATPTQNYSIRTGRETDFSARPYPNRFFVFPLSLAPNSVQSFYLRVQSLGPVSIPVKLWQPAAFHAHERSDYANQAWYFGGATAMALFNLLLFLALRDVMYLLYVNFVSCMALTMAIQNGLDKEYFWQAAPLWSNIATNVGYSLTLACLLIFMRRMLSTAAIVPGLDRLLQALLVIFFLTPIAFVISLQSVIKPAALLYGFTAVLILITSLVCALKRQRSAYFFLSAFSVLCFAAITTVLRALGLVSTNQLTTNILQLGSIFEMLVLAFALADRFNAIRRAHELAQNLALDAQRQLVETLTSSERILEERVIQRTLELDKKNEKLARAMRSLEDVERIARHDLKTPLASIIAAPKVLRAGRILEDQEEKVLNMIEHAARRALSMVNLSLDLFQMESGTYVLRPVSVNLSALAADVAQDLSAHAQSKSVNILISEPASPTLVEAEDALCYSVIANLLKNAVEAAPPDSDVQVLLQSGEKVRLSIQNQGAIPEALRENFFAKYATSGKSGGIGLGTYSAHLLAKIQGGNLSMSSSIQDGTTLLLELKPAHSAPIITLEERPAKPIISLPKSTDRQRRILLVDDDEFNLMIMSELIPQSRFVLDTALNGRLALEAIKQQRPDIIIMDLDMPVMGGIEALAEIRAWQAQAGHSASLIAAYSGNDDAQSHADYLALGFDHCLSKPCSEQELLTLLSAEIATPVSLNSAFSGEPQNHSGCATLASSC
ncbi:7TM diverse intracellular signaling domain-containing protein [Undibacterium sp.]|uniref:hybrid sensor histidine kinase/response regulator n=1 Tax=Undibacterium sp. TaxID=1914977 RepID=UPI0025EF57D2|nr:7TM diverse intracellular signaling domain-containing protein [Undibacterium sp.]